jgi:lysophospholipase L1-like esterase
VIRYVLCYGDSNTWGCIPGTTDRFNPEERWPGILQKLLGPPFHIYENGMNGRTTVFDDPIEEHRSGKAQLPAALLCAAPLDLVIFMLGTNDTKNRFNLNSEDIAWGMDLLVQYVKKSGSGWRGGVPEILIISPPAMGRAWSRTILGMIFGEASNRRVEALPSLYRGVAEKQGVHFLDAAPLTEPGVDSLHLDAASHRKLAEAVAAKVGEIFPEGG